MPSLNTELFESLIDAFGHEVDKPTPELGGVRCISRRTFGHVWKRMKVAHAPLQRSHLSTADALGLLVDAGLLTAVQATEEETRSNLDTLYIVGWGVSQSDLDPLDILTALEPSGIICYFSAFALHGLTTQVPTHHHVATLVDRPLPADVVGGAASNAGKQRLGALRARINGLPYYSTQRTARLVAGVQRRTLSPWLVVRCTTVAQTLIDGVMRAFSCGGPAVVIEAWEQAAEVTKAETLIDLAAQIGHPPVARRVGYMIEMTAGLCEQVSAVQLDRLFPAGQEATPIPLFPGLTPRSTNARWQVQVP